MTALWIIVVLLLLATLLCLIPPLLRRAPAAQPASEANVRAFYLAQREQLRRDMDNGSLTAAAGMRAEEELQRDLLQDLDLRRGRGAPWAGQRAGITAACLLTVLIPVAAVLLYGQLGNPRAAASASAGQPAEPHAADAGNDMTLAINALAQRLRTAPDDADGWYMLARSYETLGRYTDAVAAYQQVLRLVPGQPAVLADLADALLSANQGNPDDASIAAVAQALAAQPDQPKALALAGMMALRRGDAAEALAHWERLQAQLPPDSEAARQIQSNIAQARTMAGAPASATATASAPGSTPVSASAPAAGAAPTPAVTAARISGRASIADALRGRVQPSDTVFILARPEEGSRMPLAILRMQVSDLPRDFVLDDSSAMSPDATLSRASKVRVEIRVSKSGTAAARAGDLGGALSGIGVHAEGLTLVADTVVP
ncbi:c-type cytochrome biogenesis protein CcmI [Achromobacter xylosoxidans]|uniref:C-type cytochrome biogenesis protein CcmI n=1 Tax=Alcaligenes xylosoxydans xylosoxydans TaxID=85698 RepID=A0A424W6L8_ALCXX|nr:c-type cytochrome biogenesis protein CcmI [Achromobacter xylosoxidans]MBC9907088.1 c-type cytochrome biogenesis protein CcmI [Achromobacter xylosoxidans]MBD0871997.1 c-type cytochrome biogenesis protein CcmI [Achromobacter xylosoxidans]QNP83768.1 c-type cytochrome biogenesis protein CcmI [Achromobacter xylosoxidans]RPJ88912.1 c-type cytochrome biogenesis protein CcmI [Achromobacter xylosoxidans]